MPVNHFYYHYSNLHTTYILVTNIAKIMIVSSCSLYNYKSAPARKIFMNVYDIQKYKSHKSIIGIHDILVCFHFDYVMCLGAFEWMVVQSQSLQHGVIWHNITYSVSRRSIGWRKNRLSDTKSLVLNGEHHVDGVVQDCSISIAHSLEILQSCIKPSKCNFWVNLEINNRVIRRSKLMFLQRQLVMSSGRRSWHKIHFSFNPAIWGLKILIFPF